MNILVLVLIGILVPVLFFSPFILIDKLRNRKNNVEGQESNEEKEEASPERDDGTGVYAILMSAFRSLNEQRAAGFRNWIPACIERIQRGDDVTPEIALLALKKTRDELYFRNGRPYDLNELGRAILALEVETGEWG